jgi:hypothetical protein
MLRRFGIALHTVLAGRNQAAGGRRSGSGLVLSSPVAGYTQRWLHDEGDVP